MITEKRSFELEYVHVLPCPVIICVTEINSFTSVGLFLLIHKIVETYGSAHLKVIGI
jgi:hypothetical protein